MVGWVGACILPSPSRSRGGSRRGQASAGSPSPQTSMIGGLLSVLLAVATCKEVDAALLGGPSLRVFSRSTQHSPLPAELPLRWRGGGHLRGHRSAHELIAASAAAGDGVGSGEGWTSKAIAYTYVAYALGFALLLLRTLKKFPLIPPSPNSLDWCRQWLWTTVADYYGAALALCGVILATERRPYNFAWAAGCLFLGTPVCCFYAAFRLLRHGTLQLAQRG